MTSLRTALLLSVVAAATVQAQENYEIQVYGSETMAPRATIYELHSNFTPIGRTLREGSVLPTNRQWHETVEITRGLNEWSEIGFYAFNAITPGYGLQFVGTHIRPRVRAPESWNLPVGLSLSTEFGWQSEDYSADTWSIEIRPIIDKQMGAWYASLNPTVEKSLRGPNAAEGFEFAPNATVTRDITRLVNVGVEYYGAWGSTKAFAPPNEREHLVFGVVNLDISPEWEFNAGIGFGTGASQEKRVVKLILGRRVGPVK